MLEELETLPHEVLLNPHNGRLDQKRFSATDVRTLLRTKVRLLGIHLPAPPPPRPGSMQERFNPISQPVIVHD